MSIVWLSIARALGVTALLLMSVSAAAASERVAVFPFELLDNSQADEIYPKVRPEETARLARLTEDLRTRLAQTDRYQIASLDTVAADIEKFGPLYKCNGCEADIVKKSGADIGMLGLVQKFSDTLLSVNIEVIDGKSGKVTATYTAGIQGNTEDAWMHAMHFIVKNRIMTDGTAP